MLNRPVRNTTTLVIVALIACGGDGPTAVPALASISVAINTPTRKIGETATATATAKDATGLGVQVPGDSVVWKSSNASVATISTTGALTAILPGTTNITASARGISSAAAVLTVSAAQLTITASPTTASSGVAFTTQPAVEIRDVVANSVIATATMSVTASVSSGGTLAGTATKAAVAGVVTFTDLKISGSGTFTLSFAVVPVGASPPITTVTSAGIAVIAPVASVTLTPPTGSVIVGGVVNLTATPLDAGSTPLTGRAVSFLSSNPSVATVSSSGVVTGVAPGTSNITASSEGQTSSAAVITIAPAVSGTVSLAGGAGIGGGLVQIKSGSTIVQTITVPAGGTYQLNTIAAGTYALVLQPPVTHSMGPAEPAQRSITVSANQAGSSLASFVVQPAFYYDGFQSYTTSQIVSGQTASCNQGGVPIAPGSFFYDPAAGHTMACSKPSFISMDLTGGPGGSRAFRYDWSANAPTDPVGCTGEPLGADYSIELQPYFGTSAVFPDTVWIRFTDKLSTGFAHGSTASGCFRGYKYFLANFGPGGLGRTGIHLVTSVAQNPGPALATAFNDQEGHSYQTHSPLDPPLGQPAHYDLGPGFTGVYHTWLLQIFGMGTTTMTLRAYLDGVQVSEVVGSFYTAQTKAAASQLVSIQLGANINHGPDAAQSRWFRDLGVYFTRPSSLPPP